MENNRILDSGIKIQGLGSNLSVSVPSATGCFHTIAMPTDHPLVIGTEELIQISGNMSVDGAKTVIKGYSEAGAFTMRTKVSACDIATAFDEAGIERPKVGEAGFSRRVLEGTKVKLNIL